VSEYRPVCVCVCACVCVLCVCTCVFACLSVHVRSCLCLCVSLQTAVISCARASHVSSGSVADAYRHVTHSTDHARVIEATPRFYLRPSLLSEHKNNLKVSLLFLHFYLYGLPFCFSSSKGSTFVLFILLFKTKKIHPLRPPSLSQAFTNN
jgi:type III secretory pathway component EscU